MPSSTSHATTNDTNSNSTPAQSTSNGYGKPFDGKNFFSSISMNNSNNTPPIKVDTTPVAPCFNFE